MAWTKNQTESLRLSVAEGKAGFQCTLRCRCLCLLGQVLSLLQVSPFCHIGALNQTVSRPVGVPATRCLWRVL